MQLELNIWERAFLIAQTRELQGPAGLMHKALKVLDGIEFSSQEKKRIGFQWTAQGPSWNQRKDYEKKIEINDKEAAHLTRRVVRELIENTERSDGWRPDFFRKVNRLAEKVGVDVEAILQKLKESSQKPEGEDAN